MRHGTSEMVGLFFQAGGGIYPAAAEERSIGLKIVMTRDAKNLYNELQSFQEQGIQLQRGVYKVSPVQMVSAYMAREEGTYMRDYVLDPQGKVESLVFTEVEETAGPYP